MDHHTQLLEYVYMCFVCVRLYTPECSYLQRQRSQVKIPPESVIDGYELPKEGAENGTQVL